MISQVTANPKSNTSNEYGFYAIPKTIKPKAKYRDRDRDRDNEYEEETYSKHEEPRLVPLTEKEDQDVERDFFVDQPPFPEFVPKEPGVDEEVQVDDYELFDFEQEVEPLLQVLVGQSVLKARNELQEESEQKESKRNLEVYQKKRQAELMVTQRLETQHKRRNEENDRRLLQYKVYNDQKKLVLKKLHVFDRSKRALMNLKVEVLDDLESDGFLRYDIFVRMRSELVPWLYDQIQLQLVDKSSVTSVGEQILNEKQEQLKKKHQDSIQKEVNRRREILDQRERERLAEEERKKKKAIKKERLALHKGRVEKEDRLYEIMSKGQKLESILKGEISDNYSRNRPAVFVSGGPWVFLSDLLASLSQQGISLSESQLQNVIIKMLKEFQFPVTFNLPPDLKESILQMESESKSQQATSQRVEAFVDEIVDSQEVVSSTYYQQLASSDSNLKPIIKVLLRIYFTQPGTGDKPTEGQTAEEAKPELTEAQKLRLSVKPNLRLSFEGSPTDKPTSIIRLRFPRKRPQDPKEEQEIEVFDGEGWQRLIRDCAQRQNVQSPMLLNLSGFQTSVISDQVSNHHFCLYLFNTLSSSGIPLDRSKLEEFSRSLSDKYSNRLQEKYGGKEVPIYDVEYE